MRESPSVPLLPVATPNQTKPNQTMTLRTLKKMKNNYIKLSAQISAVIAARADQQKVARILTGVIAGGPSIETENATWETESATLCEMVERSLSNGARIKNITEMLAGCPCIGMDPIIDQYRAGYCADQTPVRIKVVHGYYYGTINAPRDGYLMDHPIYDSRTGVEIMTTLEFASVADAVGYLTTMEDGPLTDYDGNGDYSVSGTYYAAHGQHSRPVYTIVARASGRCTKAIVAACDAIANG